MRPPKPPSTGFLCVCGGKTMCLDSRPGMGGSIRRRRKCLTCGNRLTTYELDLLKYRAMLAALNALSKQAQGVLRSIGAEHNTQN